VALPSSSFPLAPFRSFQVSPPLFESKVMDLAALLAASLTPGKFHIPPGSPALEDTSFTFAELLARDDFAEVRELILREECLPADAVDAVLAWEHLPALRELWLFWRAASHEDLLRLLRSPRLLGLERTQVCTSWMKEEHQVGAVHVLDEIARRATLPALRRLTIAGMQAGEEGAATFGRIRVDRYPQLRTLEYVLDPSAKGAQLVALAENPSLAQIERLDFGCTGITADALRVFLPRAKVSSLRCLGLSAARDLGDEGLRVIVTHAAALPALERLQLTMLDAGDAGLEAIANAPLPGLRELNLDANFLSPDGLTAIGRASLLPQLRKLALCMSWSLTGWETIHAFLQTARFEALEELVIDGRTLTGDDVRFFRAYPSVARQMLEGWYDWRGLPDVC
jgi:hypothetical protein